MNIPDITLIITNWNGRELLRECLPSILQSVTYDKKRSYEIMVVDDCSSDDSLEVLAREFPIVRAEKTPVNYGFHGANNFGAGLARSRLIMPMNNDIKLDEEALYHLAEHFEGKDTFAVSGKFYAFDGTTFLYGNRFELLEALRCALAAAPGVDAVHEVEVEVVTVRDRMFAVMERLDEAASIEFMRVFEGPEGVLPSKVLLVATFLAILELARLGALRIYQPVAFNVS